MQNSLSQWWMYKLCLQWMYGCTSVSDRGLRKGSDEYWVSVASITGIIYTVNKLMDEHCSLDLWSISNMQAERHSYSRKSVTSL